MKIILDDIERSNIEKLLRLRVDIPSTVVDNFSEECLLNESFIEGALLVLRKLGLLRSCFYCVGDVESFRIEWKDK